MAGLGGLSGPVDNFPFNFCRSVFTLCLFWHECLVSNVVCDKCQKAAKTPFVTARKAFLSPWTGCNKKVRDVVRENEVKEGGTKATSPFELSWLAWILRFLLQFEHCVPFSGCGLSFILFVPLCCV